MKKTLLFMALFGAFVCSAQQPLSCINNPPLMEDWMLQDLPNNIRASSFIIYTPGCNGDSYPLLTVRPTDGQVFQTTGNLASFLAGYAPVSRTLTINGVTQDMSANRSWTITTSRTINNNVARSLNSNFTISATRDAQVSYSVSLSVTNPLLAGSSTATAFLEYSIDGGTNWVTVAQAANGSSVALSVTISITAPNTFNLSAVVPANALTRIRTVTTGTASATFVRAQEVLL